MIDSPSRYVNFIDIAMRLPLLNPLGPPLLLRWIFDLGGRTKKPPRDTLGLPAAFCCTCLVIPAEAGIHV
jgi:hypothetical protein